MADIEHLFALYGFGPESDLPDAEAHRETIRKRKQANRTKRRRIGFWPRESGRRGKVNRETRDGR